MAQHTIETQWMGKMQFNALIADNTIVMDAPARAGGEDNGPIPKPLLLVALSGCTGMETISLLRKDHIIPDDLNVKVIAELSKQPPYVYTQIHIIYEVKAPPSCMNAVCEVIRHSQEEICGVSQMLRKALPITWSIDFNNEVVFSNQAGTVKNLAACRPA